MFNIFLEALKFASEKHLTQRRKGYDQAPYINHLIEVVHILNITGKENDPEILAAGLLHDVLEDTSTTANELKLKFGERITNIVIEVTDDMRLTYDDRKREQIHKAPYLSSDAKKIKIADKISNIEDILKYPVSWSHRKKRQYVEWSENVIIHCKGINPLLDEEFDKLVIYAKEVINE